MAEEEQLPEPKLSDIEVAPMGKTYRDSPSPDVATPKEHVPTQHA